MNGATPTRSAALERKEERAAMREGHRFLDEKCMLLASELVRELDRYATLRAEFEAAWAAAIERLRDAVTRHGLDGLQVYRGVPGAPPDIERERRSLMGVALLQARGGPPPPRVVVPSVRSPEGDACGGAFSTLVDRCVALAAVSGNLERLRREYRRTARRARALQDVLLPELDRSVYDIELRLEELEREDATWMRRGAR